MATNLSVCDTADEDYIDMEVSSSSFFLCSLTSPPHHREFEFPGTLDKERTTSPADELFYKGKLLPLHLPPRLQMVEKLLQNTNTPYDNKEENFNTPSTTAFHTPSESCNISPSDSCQVSRELNAEEYLLDFPDETSRFIEEENPKKSWSKKLKLIKQSSFSHKLKASRAYLKALFSKSGCSAESCKVAASDGAEGEGEGPVTIAKECLNKYTKFAKKHPFGQIQRERYQQSARGTDREKMIDDNVGHRMSFSGAITCHSETNKSSSSNSSSSSLSGSNSNWYYELHLLKRSSSANSEIESSVQGAIAHCKQSHTQHPFHTRSNTSEAGFSSFSASRIAACEDQERLGVCRG